MPGAVHPFRDQLLRGAGDRGKASHRYAGAIFYRDQRSHASTVSVQLSGHQGYRSGRWIPGKDGGLSALRRHTCDHRKTIAGGGAVPAGSKGISGKAVRPYTLSQRVSLVGIGMGAEKNTDPGRKEGLDEAELLIGAKRMTDAVQRPGQMVLHEYRSDKIVDGDPIAPALYGIVIRFARSEVRHKGFFPSGQVVFSAPMPCLQEKSSVMVRRTALRKTLASGRDSPLLQWSSMITGVSRNADKLHLFWNTAHIQRNP